MLRSNRTLYLFTAPAVVECPLLSRLASYSVSQEKVPVTACHKRRSQLQRVTREGPSYSVSQEKVPVTACHKRRSQSVLLQATG